jgi:hypothetical protein
VRNQGEEILSNYDYNVKRFRSMKSSQDSAHSKQGSSNKSTSPNP